MEVLVRNEIANHTSYASVKGLYSFQIQPQDVDFQYKATLAAFTNILLTTAGYNADENGFGIRKLNEIDSSWVLLRLAIDFYKFPEQYDTIQIETWIEEVGRATTTRNFSIRNAQNEIIANASSVWAMINLSTRRAQDLIVLEGIQGFACHEKVNIEKPIKLSEVGGEAIDVFKVKYSDIDINHHTNSMSYIKWISDCFSLDTYKQKNIKRFEINYINEILFDNEVSIFANEIKNNDFRFEIHAENKTSCRARILFMD